MIKRLSIGIVFTCIIGYIIYLLFNGVFLVNGSTELNYITYGILILVFTYYLVFYSIIPTYIKGFKVINTIVGLFVVVISYKFLVNSGYEGIYYGDIFNVIGIILTIIGPTNLLVSKEIKKDKDDKNMEIIEID